MIVFVAFGFYYMALVNDKATVGYKISSLEKEIAKLDETNSKFKLEMIELGQITRVEQKAAAMHMVVATDLEYLTAVDDGLARR